jgi:hypothetical protein
VLLDAIDGCAAGVVDLGKWRGDRRGCTLERGRNRRRGQWRRRPRGVVLVLGRAIEQGGRGWGEASSGRVHGGGRQVGEGAWVVEEGKWGGVVAAGKRRRWIGGGGGGGWVRIRGCGGGKEEGGGHGFEQRGKK